MSIGERFELPGTAQSGTERAAGVTLLHLVQLALGSAWHRKLLAGTLFVLGLGAALGYYVTRTPIYRVEAKVFAQRPQALPSVVRPLFEDVPTRSAWEMIHRRENLMALVNEAGLLAGREGQPAQTGTSSVPRPTSSGQRVEGAPLDMMINQLDRRLLVMVEEGTITIRFDWADPQQTYAVVNGALQNFLEARHLQEVTAIDEVINVLQGRSDELRKAYEAAIDTARRRTTQPAREAPRRTLPSQELVRLKAAIDSKHRAIEDVEEFRRRRLADVLGQLEQARNTFSDVHPTVIGLRQQVEALKRESPQVEALRDEERKLRQAYSDRLEREGITSSPVHTPAMPPPEREEDQRVRDARLQLEQMDARVSAALVERDAARAAFKYRYNVVWPPQVPKEPVAPNAVKIIGAGAIGSLFLAVFAAAIPDVLRGRMLQRWQVERLLDVPVVGEIKRS